MTLVLILLALIAFIVLSTTRPAAPVPRPAGGRADRRLRLPGTHGGNRQDRYRRLRQHPRLHRHRHRARHHHRGDPRAQRCGDHHGGKRDPPARRTLPDPDHVDHRLPGVDPGVLRFRLRHPQLAEERPGGADEDIHHRHERGPGHRSLRHPHLRAADPGTDRRGRQPRPGRQPWPGDRGRPGGRLRHRDGRHVVGQSLRRQGHSPGRRRPGRPDRRGLQRAACPLRQAAQRRRRSRRSSYRSC